MKTRHLPDFRPRVGMGWFKKPKDYARRHMRFSSPSGDGVVLIKKRREHYDNQIFVPEWGWVGS